MWCGFITVPTVCEAAPVQRQRFDTHILFSGSSPA